MSDRTPGGFALAEPGALDALARVIDRLADGMTRLPAADRPEIDAESISALMQAAERLHDNFPYAHPLYAGQMLKPPHPVARIAYQLAQAVNPNNHALDGGRASSAMEKQAVAEIAAMFGLQQHLGHLTSGGTVANLEALWVARQERPGQAVAASADAHYTHSRLSAVLGMPFVAIAADARGRMDLAALEEALVGGDIGTVVATAGTTSTGAVDPVHDIAALCARYGARLHVDAAYGGYFRLSARLDDDANEAFRACSRAHSIAIDPHKHGLQPYGCGCILFADPAVGRHYRHDSPYTYFSSDALHLGEISLECSRAGAAAVALWTTQRRFPLRPGGEFAGMLDRCLSAARELADHLRAHRACTLLQPPELDIVVWAVKADRVSAASRRARAVFDAAARRDLHLALIELDVERFGGRLGAIDADQPTITCLRSCLMKPEHADWVGEIASRLDEAIDEVIAADAETSSASA